MSRQSKDFQKKLEKELNQTVTNYVVANSEEVTKMFELGYDLKWQFCELTNSIRLVYFKDNKVVLIKEAKDIIKKEQKNNDIN